MPKYFAHFPTVTYRNVEVTDISRRARFKEKIASNPYAFLPYVVEHDDRPEDVAFLYYGDPGYVWAIFLANDIVDPYNQWPMTYEDFNKFFIKKYQSMTPESTGFEVIHWAQNTLITENIKLYRNIEDPTIEVSPDTLTLLSDDYEASEWYAVRFYEYEHELNESRRDILMVNKIYIDQMEKELETILNE